MTDTATTPQQHLADLEERIREGDTTVTAPALAKARDAAQLADLHDQAAQRAAEQAAAADLERRRQTFRDGDLAELASVLAQVRADHPQLVATARRIRAGLDRYQRLRRAARATARDLGIRDEVDDLTPDINPEREFNTAIKESTGRFTPGITRRPGDPPRLQRSPIHSPEYTAAVDAHLAGDPEPLEQLFNNLDDHGR